MSDLKKNLSDDDMTMEIIEGTAYNDGRKSNKKLAISLGLIALVAVVGAGFFVGSKGIFDKTAKQDNEQVPTLNDENDKTESKYAKGVTPVDMDTLNEEYVIELEGNKDWSIDLDGDGKEEIINYGIKRILKEVNSDDVELSVSINGSENFELNGVYSTSLGYPDEQSFLAIDLDNTDNSYELVFIEWHEGATGTTSYVYKYEQGKLIELKDASTWLPAIEYNYENIPGRIKTATEVDLFGGNYIINYVQYNKNTNEFRELTANEYKFNRAESKEYYIQLHKELTVYEEADKKSAKKIMKPQMFYADTVKYLENDSYAAYLIAEDGTEGWIIVDGMGYNNEYIDGVSLYEYFCTGVS